MIGRSWGNEGSILLEGT